MSELSRLFKTFLVLLLILTVLLMFFFSSHNYLQLNYCDQLDGYEETVLDISGVVHVCYVIEDGEELNIFQYDKKHKYDGINVRN